MARSRALTGAAAAERLRQFALSMPGAYEDFPWGELVVKVNKKVFVFMGMADRSDAGVSLTVKLPESCDQALSQDYASRTGYGLGKAGWVSLRWEAKAKPPIDLCTDWIEESYRAIAPKKLVAELDARAG